jgi:hypothetical protein
VCPGQTTRGKRGDASPATVSAEGSGPLNWAALPTQWQGAQRPSPRLSVGVGRKSGYNNII